MGFSVSGPASRAILARLTDADVSDEAFPFMACAAMRRRRGADAVVGRLALTGELGYEIVVPTRRSIGPCGTSSPRPARPTACGRSATTRSTACASRRATASGTPSSRRTTRRGWPAWTGSSRGTRARSSGARRPCASATTGAAEAPRAARGRRRRRRGRARRRHLDRRPARGLRHVGRVRAHVGMSLALGLIETRGRRRPRAHGLRRGRPRTARILPDLPYDPAGARLRG